MKTDKKVYGFDTFEGFPSVSEIDQENSKVKTGMFSVDYDVYKELSKCIEEYDQNRFINNQQSINIPVDSIL